MSEKIIRDPVHDVIAFRTNQPLDALLFRLLNAAEFQRLRRVHQLGLAALAYPGADHSRYSHSLGVMETARQMLDQLAWSFEIDPEQRRTCLVAALLHDLGHGPFSHVFERVSGTNHEELTQRVILDPDAEVHQILIDADPALPQRVVELMRCRPARTFYSDILCSQLDADRFDYLLRDNLMTGSRYGDYDLRWLLHALTLDRSGTRLAVTLKGVSAVEAYLQSRFHMYRNVYFHKVVRSAEGMVKLALQRARRLAVQNRLVWPGREDPVFKALLGQALSIRQFTELDDVSVLQCFKVWSTCDDAVLARLCEGLLYRRLYKTIDLSHETPQRAAEQVARAQDFVNAAGGEWAYDLFYDEPADALYEIPSPAGEPAEGEIMVRDEGGGLIPFASLSPLTQSLSRQLTFRRLHVAPQWMDRIRHALSGPREV
jgi:HD superfamily phosphohydrolase